MSEKTISAADLAKLSDALKAARPVPSGDCQGLMIESAASLARAAASIMKGK